MKLKSSEEVLEIKREESEKRNKEYERKVII
jgi:hypothetical protein